MVHECILSQEAGTTQGDVPLAMHACMAMYAMVTLPMIQHLQQEADIQEVNIWYADDSAGGRDTQQL